MDHSKGYGQVGRQALIRWIFNGDRGLPVMQFDDLTG